MAYQSVYPNIPVPPNPCVTRWGTWLKAAVYYTDYFQEVRTVIEMFDSNDSEAIGVAHNIFNSSHIKLDLAYIKINFSSIVTATVRLESQGLPLKESIAIFENIRQSLTTLEDQSYSHKMDAIIKRNKGYNSLFNINKIINECCIVEDAFAEKLSPAQLAFFSVCPVTSADVERSFSSYGSILAEKRRAFSFDNLKQYFIVFCNK